jgi:hypothetical protein
MSSMTLSRRVAHALLRCYPPAWRRRYAEEVRALVDESEAGWRLPANLGVSAAREWLSPRPAAWPTVSSLTRAHLATLFASWTGSIALAWVSVYLGETLRWSLGRLPESAGLLAVGMWGGLSALIFTGSIRNAIALTRGLPRMPVMLGGNLLLGLLLTALVAGILERAAEDAPSSFWLMSLYPYFRAISLGPVAWEMSAWMIRLNRVERLAAERHRRSSLQRHVGPRLDLGGSTQL